MGKGLDKPQDLGVLDSFGQIDTGLKAIRKDLRRKKNRAKGIQRALNNVRDLRIHLKTAFKDAKKLDNNVKAIIKLMTDNVLPFIEEPKVKGATKDKKEKTGGRSK